MSTLLKRGWFNRRIPTPRQAPPSRIAMSMPADVAGLRFTEWILVGVLGLAYMFSISVPLFGVPLQITGLKHFPLMLLVPAVALHLLGMKINRKHLAVAGIVAACWPLFVLAIYVTAGSLVGKELMKVQEGFLTFGLYLFLLPLLALLPTQLDDSQRWIRAVAGLWITAALAALIGAAARLPATQTLHEIEYIVISAFVMLWYLARGPGLRTLALLLMLAAAGLDHKLTGYIVTLMALFLIALETGWRRVDRNWRGAFIAVSFILVSATVLALVAVYSEFRSVLPTGSPEVRLNQYGEAWRQFVASPIWGTAYTESSGEDFRESTRLFNIPTHSDVLDMLKHGGIIGFGLFALGYWKIFRLLSSAGAARRDDRPMHAYFLVMRFFQVSALLTFSLNPLLLKGPFVLVIFGNLGLAVGVALVALKRKGAVS